MFFALGGATGAAMVFAIILAYLAALVLGFVFHESAHAYAATKQGDPTPKMMGRLSLNPAKHIDPIGIVMLLLVGFGYAKPVPVNPQNFRHGRWSDFVVSSAGIFTNIAIAIVLCFVQSILQTFAPIVFLSTNFFAMLLSAFLQYGIWINLSLAFFNLIPIPPLDGFGMLESMLGPKGYKFSLFMRRYSFVFMIVMLVVVMFVFNFVGYLSMLTEFGISWVFDKFFGLFV